MNKKERLENSMEQKRGRASILFEHPPVIRSIASVAGTKEGKGPLGSLFDAVERKTGKKRKVPCRKRRPEWLWQRHILQKEK